ncbi:TonB-dependent receptor, partial [bacterium]|nr:TonB-dependent receptor [bacterium]
FTVEGPFKKGYGGSYLVNYRYSTASIAGDLGLVDLGGIPNFQDAAFKVLLPTNKAGIFSIFGLSGLSDFVFEDVTPELWNTPGDGSMRADINEDFKKKSYLLTTGINHSISVSKNSFLKTSLSYSRDGIADEVFELKTIDILDNNGGFLRDSVSNRTLNFDSRLRNSTYQGALTFHSKLSAKSKIQVGSKYSLFAFDFDQSRLQGDVPTRFTLANFNETVGTVRNFISWKHRLNEDLTLVTGVHNMNVLFNQKSTIEPRIAVNWKLNGTNSLHAGYGSHSNMESIHNYFAKVESEDGTITQPNEDLGLLKAHHFVLGYEKRFTENLMGKVEVYYQHLYNLPVENLDTSYYATINEDMEFQYVDLVNEGTGKNYGVEFTLERFFDNYYFMLNGSIYSSTYTSLEGVERNTKYNGNYLANLLAGKEFSNLGKRKNKTLGLNAKVFFGGGKKVLPLLRDNQGNLAVDAENNSYWDYDKAYENKIEDIYQVTVSASYKWNKPKATHELFMNIDNLTNTRGRLSEYYDESETNSIGHVTQFGIFPNLMYRVYF